MGSRQQRMLWATRKIARLTGVTEGGAYRTLESALIETETAAAQSQSWMSGQRRSSSTAAPTATRIAIGGKADKICSMRVLRILTRSGRLARAKSRTAAPVSESWSHIEDRQRLRLVSARSAAWHCGAKSGTECSHGRRLSPKSAALRKHSIDLADHRELPQNDGLRAGSSGDLPPPSSSAEKATGCQY
jgi:hypothetical protein